MPREDRPALTALQQRLVRGFTGVDPTHAGEIRAELFVDAVYGAMARARAESPGPSPGTDPALARMRLLLRFSELLAAALARVPHPPENTPYLAVIERELRRETARHERILVFAACPSGSRLLPVA